MPRLRDQLVSFIAALRDAGVRISVAESIDAMNAVAAVGLERSMMHEALAASLIKDEADRAVFDDAFNRFFAAPQADRGEHPDQRGDQVSAAAGRGRPGEHPTPRDDPPPRKAEQAREGARANDRDEKSSRSEAKPSKKTATVHRDNAEGKDTDRNSEAMRGREEQGIADSREESPTPGIDAARVARLRAIERMPFDNFSDLDYDEARDALAPLIRRFRIRLGRRLRLAKTGRIDFRRTIRAAMQRGGALIDLNFRARRPRHVDLVILADISGSVRYAAQLMLELMAGARGCFRRVSSFVYVDHLAEADFEQGHLVMTPALDMYARSDFGRVLGELWERRSGLLTRSTIVVIMGDGRNNRLPARADVIREIARTCRAVIWLNPEDPARWGTGDSAIKQYAREVKMLVPSRNLRELQVALAAIA
ncbi:MAG: VWA domain-containing protein [Candidatus Binatus sp.]|uniref:VWA domain-containing protein n=2 Tax=Candidatus Binatus sp. TaxID=2811406 RepID=UPI003BB13339